MVAAAVIVVCLVVVFVFVAALRYLAHAIAVPDELADADVVRQLRPDGNATKVEADE